MRRFSAFAALAVTTMTTLACSETPPMTTSGSAPSTSHVSRTSPQDAVGLWRLSTSEGGRGCLLALNINAVAGGYGVVLEDCRRSDLLRARSWRLTPGGLELRDERGDVLLGLHRRTLDLYEGRNESAAYRMERAPLA